MITGAAILLATTAAAADPACGSFEATWTSGEPLAALDKLVRGGATVDMTFVNASWGDVRETLGAALGEEILTLGPLFECRFTLGYGTVTVTEALRRLGEAHGLSYELLNDGTLRIRSPWPSWVPDMIEKPRIMMETKTNPDFPERARKDRAQGRVVLAGVIDREGRIVWIRVIDENPEYPEFTEESIETFRQWRYEPALRYGEPVDSVFTSVFDFELNGDQPPAGKRGKRKWKR